MSKFTLIPLGDLAEFINGDRGKNYPSKSDFVEYGIPFINAGHLSSGEIDFSEMNYISEDRFRKIGSGKTKPNDILYCLRGSLGKTAIVRHNGDAAIASSLVIIRPLENCCGKYLYHYLISPLGKTEIQKFDNGTSQPNLSATSVKKYQIPLPPLPEQKRIAEVLDKADALREKRRLALQKLDTLLQSVFHEMFGDPVRNPKGWDVENFGNLCSEIYRYPTYYGIEYVERGVPEIRGELILKNGEIDNNNEKLRFISKETSDKFSRTVLQAGDLVLSVRGTIGKIGFVDKSLEGANITANVIRVSPNRTKVNPRYFWQICRNEHFQRKLQEISSSTTIQTIKSPDLKAIKVLLPPFELQELFEQVYRRWKILQNSIELSAKHTESLFQTFQQRAFKGELFSDKSVSVVSQEDVWQQTSPS